MSDADDQMGGQGGDSGKDPAAHTEDAGVPEASPAADEAETPSSDQAAQNREDDPPA